MEELSRGRRAIALPQQRLQQMPLGRVCLPAPIRRLRTLGRAIAQEIGHEGGHVGRVEWRGRIVTARGREAGQRVESRLLGVEAAAGGRGDGGEAHEGGV